MTTSPSRIAIVDDDAEIVAMLVAFFHETLGVDVLPCPIGPAAPACIVAHRPQLSMLDVLLPGGRSGVDVLQAVRADPALRAVPVIFFSGTADQVRQRLPSYRAQGVQVVEQPDIEHLSAVVQRLVPPPAA